MKREQKDFGNKTINTFIKMLLVLDTNNIKLVDFAKRVDNVQSNMTRVIKQLIDCGVCEYIYSKDKRIKPFRLTEKGRAILETTKLLYSQLKDSNLIKPLNIKYISYEL